MEWPIFAPRVIVFQIFVATMRLDFNAIWGRWGGRRMGCPKDWHNLSQELLDEPGVRDWLFGDLYAQPVRLDQTGQVLGPR